MMPRASISVCLGLALAAMAGGVARAQTAAPAARQAAAAAPPPSSTAMDRELALDARDIPLGGALKTPRLWQAWKSSFVSAQGRVIDTGNAMISHSEGQGYGMLFAVAANDREAFDRIWGWTRANLMVRDDELIAWRWEPTQRPAVADMNNATDGDILIAWALTEAAELWAELSYRVAARRIAVEVGRKTILFKTKSGAILLPGVQGFSDKDRPDGPIVNLSYYVFPAFSRLRIVAPEYDWNGLTQTGLDLLKAAMKSGAKLPSDWLSVREDGVRPADGFPPNFSYNAIRVPLYMAWAGIGEKEHYREFLAWGKRRQGPLPIIDVKSGKEADSFREPGYGSVAQALECVLAGATIGGEIGTPRPGQNYYPATLNFMAALAIQMRYASCARF